MDSWLALRRPNLDWIKALNKKSVHLIKLCVGASSIEDLATWQRQHRTKHWECVGQTCAYHVTRQRPRREAELLAGGSIFWVIKGVVLVRQALLGFDSVTNASGQPSCALLLDSELVGVHPQPRRAFQGWRYLETCDAPDDLSLRQTDSIDAMPLKLRQELAALCLL